MNILLRVEIRLAAPGGWSPGICENNFLRLVLHRVRRVEMRPWLGRARPGAALAGPGCSAVLRVYRPTHEDEIKNFALWLPNFTARGSLQMKVQVDPLRERPCNRRAVGKLQPGHCPIAQFAYWWGPRTRINPAVTVDWPSTMPLAF